MEIRQLQDKVNERWSQQLNNPCHSSADAAHALLHITKALGKVASAQNDAAHQNRSVYVWEVDKYLADIVICAARFAHGIVNLETAIVSRLVDKFPTG